MNLSRTPHGPDCTIVFFSFSFLLRRLPKAVALSLVVESMLSRVHRPPESRIQPWPFPPYHVQSPKFGKPCHLVNIIKFPGKLHEACLKDYKEERSRCGPGAWAGAYVVKLCSCVGPWVLRSGPSTGTRTVDTNTQTLQAVISLAGRKRFLCHVIYCM